MGDLGNFRHALACKVIEVYIAQKRPECSSVMTGTVIQNLLIGRQCIDFLHAFQSLSPV